MMTRRGFLQLSSAAIAAFTLDPERLLWVPGQKRIFDLYTVPELQWSGWLKEETSQAWFGYWSWRDAKSDVMNPILVPHYQVVQGQPGPATVLERAKRQAHQDTLAMIHHPSPLRKLRLNR